MITSDEAKSLTHASKQLELLRRENDITDKLEEAELSIRMSSSNGSNSTVLMVPNVNWMVSEICNRLRLCGYKVSTKQNYYDIRTENITIEW